jgi:hypothetical protein
MNKIPSEVGPSGPVAGDPDILATLNQYDIVVSLTAMYEWGGYRYSSARDAIAAAKRGSIADGAS